MLHIDRRYFFSFDWISFGLTLALSGIGLAFVYSATTSVHMPYSLFFKKQAVGFLTGFCIYALFCCVDFRKLSKTGYFLYFATFLLLILTLIKGKIGMGAQRWIDLKLFRFQPSEVAKLFFPSFLTYYLYTEKDVALYTMHNFYPILGFLLLSSVLILKQPDLGTAIIFFCSGLYMLWFAGISKKFFTWGCFFFLCTAPLGYHVLKPYQKKRIAVFLGAGAQHKERYQIEQSKIAIGSGGLTGKGFTQGTQNMLLFLPESRTDFIFSVICEEWGFVGAFFVIMLYFLLFIRLLWRIQLVATFFGQLLALGLLIPIILSTCINISMISGLLPIVGIPLPLLSYGVTAIWITLASLGWIQGITMRKF